MLRQILLDTETTGLKTAEGHRLIEIGAIELVNRRFTQRHFHYYLNPEREIDVDAIKIHGLTTKFLADKPLFSQIAAEFLTFIQGAELIIHNAAFDLEFLNYELKNYDPDFTQIADHCTVLDTLPLARQLHPGARCSLDMLCKRYHIDYTHRQLHGALLDAELLGQVYLAMTGRQGHLFGEELIDLTITSVLPLASCATPILYANAQELQAHHAQIVAIGQSPEHAGWLSHQSSDESK